MRLKEHFEVSRSEVSNRLHMHGEGDIYTHFAQNWNLILRIQTCGTLAASVLKLTMARVSVYSKLDPVPSALPAFYHRIFTPVSYYNFYFTLINFYFIDEMDNVDEVT